VTFQKIEMKSVAAVKSTEELAMKSFNITRHVS